MVRLFALILVIFGGVAHGQDWQSIDGQQIRDTLSDKVVIYDNAEQKFFSSGRTLYNAGQDSWGTWAVRGDKYCSQWPPSEQWTCYSMTRAGQRVQFVDGNGNVFEGQLAE